MIPHTYPTLLTESNTRQMIIYPLTDITGLQEWIDYIPVQAPPDELAVGLANTYNADGFLYSSSLESIDGLVAFKDYIPVYVITDGTAAWSTDTGGYIPLADLIPIVVGPTDPDFSSVSLLLHADGDNNSTTFTDSSPRPKTFTVNGNAKISTTLSKFGGSSAYFDGTGDYLSTPDNNDFDLGSGSFTIEMFLYIPTGAPSGKAVLNKGTWPTNASSFLLLYNSGILNFWASANGTTWSITDLRFTNSLPTNTWHHVAVVRNGTSFKTYLNGTNFASITSSITLHDNALELTIASGSGGVNTLNCYVDELRITKGVARYTADFTVPAEAFPNA